MDDCSHPLTARKVVLYGYSTEYCTKCEKLVPAGDHPVVETSQEGQMSIRFSKELISAYPLEERLN